jgi:uncharacterized protein
VRDVTGRVARRMAVTRQRLAGPRPPAGAEGIMEIIRDVRSLQLDPISVVARSHELVVWSRLGPYRMADLERLRWNDRAVFEYWAHAASIVLTEDYPIHSLLMRKYLKPQPKEGAWRRRLRLWHEENQALRRYVLAALRRRGPLMLRDFEDRSVTGWHSGGWTTGRNVERMLDVLAVQGKVVVSGRVGGQKVFDLAERWFPDWTPRQRLSERQVEYRAAQLSLRGLGIATPKQIAFSFPGRRYHQLPGVLERLRKEGAIHQVRIVEDGWERPGPWFVHADDLPLLDSLERGEWEPRTTLLSPFDNLVIDRDRAEALFGFRFRMEIYVPKTLRQYGYYVLPILHGDRIIGRLDPAMDRKRSILRVHAVHAEPDAPLDRATGRAIGSALQDLAEFLGATALEISATVPRGWKSRLS